MRNIRIGLVGLMQLNFRGDKIGQYNRSKAEMLKLSQELDFEFFAPENPAVTPADAAAARKELEDREVDLLLIQNSSFASGYLIEILAKAKAYIGLWAVPEQTKEGPLPLNSFCGMNLNASIIGEYLKNDHITFKWFYGNVNDPLFLERFKITLGALNAAVNLQNDRIALVGGVAPGFDNFYYDERLLEKRFGARAYRLHEFQDIKKRALSYSFADIRDTIAAIKAETVSIAPRAAESLESHARVYRALQDFAEDNGYSALAISCWPRFREEMGMVPCAAIARLNDSGIVTACEGDVYSALSMLILKYAAQYAPILMDLSDFDFEDETMLLWHCGVGSKYYAANAELRLEQHYNPGPQIPGKGWLTMAPVTAMKFAPGAATVMRLTKEGSAMLLLSGEFVTASKLSHDGSRGWFGNMELNGEPINLKDLMNTIIVHKFQHHYPLVKGCFVAELLEFAAWLGIKPLAKIPYRNYLQLE
jgi:L-fucose isomerase-like protein